MKTPGQAAQQQHNNSRLLVYESLQCEWFAIWEFFCFACFYSHETHNITGGTRALCLGVWEATHTP